MGGKIQAELENIALIWFGWYRLYREVLGTLLGVNRNEEALLLAEASLKVRIDNKQNEKVLEYRKQMQAAVLAIALSTKNYDRAYPGRVQDRAHFSISINIEGNTLECDTWPHKFQ